MTSVSSPPRPSEPRADLDPAAPIRIERHPWSEIGPSFISEWGRPRGKQEPEHVQVLGPTGSGKGVLLRDILLERARRRQSHMVFIATKPADKTTLSMGWPIVDSWREVIQHEQVIFWPRTTKLGQARKDYLRAKVNDLLGRLWTPDSNTVVIWDEIGRIEKLGPDSKELVEMYFTEGRSLGITNVFGKQRTQGVQRDATANTDWKFTFRMGDQADTERVAELFGPRRQFVPVINGLDRQRFEFLVQHKLDMTTVISWVDKPVRAPARQTGYRKG